MNLFPLRTFSLVGGVFTLVLACGCTPKAEKQFAESNQQFLNRYLSQNDTDFQRQAVIAVAESPDATQPWAKKAFVDLSGMGEPSKKSKDALVRQAATFGLFKSEYEYVPDLVVLMQKDPSPVVRQSAAHYLAVLGENGRVAQEDWPTVRQATLDALTTERDVDVKVSIIRLMGCIRDKEVLNRLIDQLSSDNFLLQNQTEKSLGRLTGQTFGTDQSAWKKWLAETSDPFAKGGELPPQLAKKELSLLERMFVNYRWKPKSQTQSPFELQNWKD